MKCKPCEDKNKFGVVNPTTQRTIINHGSSVSVKTTEAINIQNTNGNNSNNNNTSNNTGSNTVDHCPTNNITHIGKVGDYLVVTMDDCTFYKVKLNKLDIASFSTIHSVITNIEPKENKLLITFHNQVTGEESIKELELTPATNEYAGVVRLATEAESLLGEHTEAVLTPFTGLKLILQELLKPENIVEATQTNKGIVRLATIPEALSNTGSEVLTSETGTELIKQELKKPDNLLKATMDNIGSVRLKTKLVGNDGSTLLGYLVDTGE